LVAARITRCVGLNHVCNIKADHHNPLSFDVACELLAHCNDRGLAGESYHRDFQDQQSWRSLKLPPRLRFALVAIAGVIFYVAIYAHGSHSEGYQFLDQAIRIAPSVRERIGDVQTVELSVFGRYREKASGDSQWVTMKLNVTGKNGSGTILASAKKKNGVWEVTDASMDGGPISLNKSVVQ
jgi:hypothetical protein